MAFEFFKRQRSAEELSSVSGKTPSSAFRSKAAPPLKTFTVDNQELGLEAHFKDVEEPLRFVLEQSDAATAPVPATYLDSLQSLASAARHWKWENDTGQDEGVAPPPSQCMLCAFEHFRFDRVARALVKALVFAQSDACDDESRSFCALLVARLMVAVIQAAPPAPAPKAFAKEPYAPTTRPPMAKAKARAESAPQASEGLPPEACKQALLSFFRNLFEAGFLRCLVTGLRAYYHDADTTAAFVTVITAFADADFKYTQALMQDADMIRNLLKVMTTLPLAEQVQSTSIRLADMVVDDLPEADPNKYKKVLQAVLLAVNTHSASSSVQNYGWNFLANAARDGDHCSDASYKLLCKSCDKGKDDVLRLLCDCLRVHRADDEVQSVANPIFHEFFKQEIAVQEKKYRRGLSSQDEHQVVMAFNEALQLGRVAASADIDDLMDRAFKLAMKAVPTQEHEIVVLACQSRCYSEREKYEDALACAKKCTEQDSGWAMGWYCQGVAYVGMGANYEDSVGAFTKAVERETDAEQIREIQRQLCKALETMASYWEDKSVELAQKATQH